MENKFRRNEASLGLLLSEQFVFYHVFLFLIKWEGKQMTSACITPLDYEFLILLWKDLLHLQNLLFR